MDLQTMGKFLLAAALAMALLGLLLWAGGALGLGKLPGDVRLGGKGWSCYVPIVSSIVLSIILTILLNLLLRALNR
jgi:phosphotransferase system  glucose/maltose/N-acetylglucosamine-specific IIC component